MLKLNKNYSDYTDETDENYPEGKAINASSSESYDGTPLLDSFMNDVNASHIAMYEKAYGSREGISGFADTQKTSQFADAVAKYSDDKLNAHKDQRGLTDGVHGATSEATAGQIASRDEFGNLKVGTAINDEDAINKGNVEAMVKNLGFYAQPLFDIFIPEIYVQLPGMIDPNKKYNNNYIKSIWEEVKLGGAFLRAEGGDAKPFTAPMKVINVSDKLLTVNNDDISTAESLATLKVGDLLIFEDEYRTVQEINGAVVKIDKAFNNSEITTVLIGQSDAMQGHKHTDSGHSHQYTLPVTSYQPYQGGHQSTYATLGNTEIGYANLGLPTKYNDEYGEPRSTIETRSKNITVRYWKRTA